MSKNYAVSWLNLTRRRGKKGEEGEKEKKNIQKSKPFENKDA